MTRTSTAYIIMLGALGIGLWIILSTGSRLEAPEDLSGTWKLGAVSPAATQAWSGPAASTGTLTIEQSGRYFQVRFDDGPPVNLKLIQQRYTDDSGARQVWLKLAGERENLVFQGQAGSDHFTVDLMGHRQPPRRWEASRVVRKYPLIGQPQQADGQS